MTTVMTSMKAIDTIKFSAERYRSEIVLAEDFPADALYYQYKQFGLGNRDDCPLCKLYNRGDMDYEKRCQGCPIYEDTGEHFCATTPYEQYSDIENCDWYDYEEKPEPFKEMVLKWLRDELAYLEDLAERCMVEE